jgi:hypothetical protein
MMPILWDMGQAAVPQFAGIGDADDVDRLAVKRDRSRSCAADAGNRLNQFDWPLPATPAMPTISPARMSNDTLSTIVTLREVLHGQIADGKLHVARLGLAFFDPEQHAAADHQLGQFADRRFLGFAGGDHRALAHDGDIVRDRHDLTQFVR